MNDIFIVTVMEGKYYSIIDIEDKDKALRYKWTKGDAQCHINRSGAAFNLDMGYARGLHHLITDAKYVDHKNGCPWDNRKCNLRPTSHHMNCANQKKQNRPTKSIYKGIDKKITKKGTVRWGAYIKQHGQKYSLGWHDTEEQAARAYDKEAKKIFGEFAKLNFPSL